MAKVLRIFAVIAGAVAIVATAGAATGLVATIAGISSKTIAAVAGTIAAVSSLGAQLLTKPPPARGGVNQTVIAVEPPRPYPMGEGYVGGVRRYDRAYGGTVDDVPNPYRWIVDVYSGHGPIDSIAPRFDYAVPDASYYSGFLGTSTQLGACPESLALALTWSGAPNWGASAKLSGCAAIGWNLKFDKDGKKFASGVPVLGAYGKWVKVYDPRLDSTQPGGLGSHRAGVESTYTWSENPALHFGTYALGRTQNGKKVFGIGQPANAIDWTAIAAWANVCDANGWKIFGRIFEPGDRWANLKDIAIAGGGVPIFSGGLLSVHFDAPAVSLGTITGADLAEGDYSTTKMQGYSNRINTIVPKITDPGSNWEQIALDPIRFSSLITADGEEKRQEFPFNLVKGKKQGAQLACYKVLNSREEGPIELPLGPQWRVARPGECYTLNIPELGLNTDAIVIKRELDPQTFTVKLTFTGETSSKHSAALAADGTVPAAVSGVQTSADRDTNKAAVLLPLGTGNRVRFSLFEAGAAPWYISAISGTSGQAISVSTISNIPTLTYTATAAASGSFGSVKSLKFPVTAGETLAVSARISTGANNASFVLRYFDSAGAAIPATPVVIPQGNGGITSGPGTPAQYLFQGFATAPATATSAEIEFFIQATAAGTISATLSQPMVTGAKVGQVLYPAFTPGPNAYDAADVTSSGIAAGIVGQGTGATASTLAGLDPAAAATLAAASAANARVAPSGTTFSMRIAAGATVALNGIVSLAAGGTNGNVKVQLQAAVSGSGSFSTFATGAGASVGPTEPNSDSVSGTFTNSTGTTQVFDFRVNALRTPGTAGGAVIASQTYIST